MASQKNACSLCQRLGLKPFTQKNILFYYVPLHSLVSYGLVIYKQSTANLNLLFVGIFYQYDFIFWF